MYRLVNRKEFKHQTAPRSVLDHTRQQISQWPPSVLIIKGTELNFTSRIERKNLGQIGNDSRLGYLCHVALAIRAKSKDFLKLINCLYLETLS